MSIPHEQLFWRSAGAVMSGYAAPTSRTSPTSVVTGTPSPWKSEAEIVLEKSSRYCSRPEVLK